MRTGRPKQPLILTEEEHDRLQSLIHEARSQPLLARRARVVLACGEGLDNKTVARKVRASLGMVGKWRSRFLQARLEGLYDEPRPGAPRQVSDAQVEQVVIQTLESTPRGETHWSTRGLAKATGLSRMTISRIWRAFGLQPHRTDTFKLSPDPLLIEKVRDIVGLVYEPARSRPGIVRGREEADSGINLVERWFAELTSKRIRRGVFRSVKDLEAAIREYIDVHNQDPKPFVWTKTADQILASIARYAQRTTAAQPS
jgi:transposase